MRQQTECTRTVRTQDMEMADGLFCDRPTGIEVCMSEMRRAVVTGMGAVTPLGLDVETTWQQLKAGANGIAPITRFDTSNYKAKLAAEVKGFDPKQYFEQNDILRTDLYAQYAVAALRGAWSRNGFPFISERESEASEAWSGSIRSSWSGDPAGYRPSLCR